MRKSLHIIGSNAFGGAERFFLRLVDALAEDAWPTGALLRPKSALAGQLHPSVELRQASMGNAWNPWYRAEVGRAIRSVAPDIVQTYMGRATRLTRLQPGRGPVHVARLGGYYDLKGYRHAHAWIGNTRGLCDHMVGQGFPADRVHHIYNFVDLPNDTALAADIPGAPPDAIIMLAVGRLEPVKGTADLLAAFAALENEADGRPLHLAILGDGPLRSDLEAQARSLGTSGRIHWLGWQVDPTPFYRRADLVVFPSREEETLGNVILEAWAHACPLVATRSRGGRELCVHGETAWLTPCGDVPALTKAIAEAIADPAARSSIGRTGFERARRDFSRQAILRQYQELYEKLTGG